MRVDDRDMIGGTGHAAFAFGYVDTAVEAKQGRAVIVGCKRAGRPD
jgi:hypothetical protein